MLAARIFLSLCVILLIGCAFSEYNLTVVHIGDFHSQWFEFNEKEGKCSDQESEARKCFGGFPRLLTLVRNIRSKEKNVIVLSSGELFLGRSLNALHGWKIANALIPRLELDAMSLSNHDFSSGMFELSAFLYAMPFPVLCANMWARETSFIYSRVNKSAILDINGEKVGIVGYLHPETLEKSRKAVSVKFSPEIPAIQEEVKRLEEKGINKIIALGHSGYHTDLEIAKNVKGLDVIIGGNSDIVLEKPDDENDDVSTAGNIHGNYPRVHHYDNDSEPALPNKTLVLHIPQHGKYIGLMRMTFDDEGRIIQESGEPVLLDSSIPQDEKALSDLKNVSLALEAIAHHKRLPDDDEVLAVAGADFECRKCRIDECSLGNLVTDAMLHTYIKNQDKKVEPGNPEKWGYVDAVVYNSGSIRYLLPAGNITIKELVHSLFAGDFMKRVHMSGEQLRKMMEHSVEKYDPMGITAPGTFLQVSGLRVAYDLNKPPGSRVRKLFIRCKQCNDTFESVKASKMYFVAMPGFIARGGDGYSTYETANSKDYGQPDIQLVVEYLKNTSVLNPKLDGRISLINAYGISDSVTVDKDNSLNTSSIEIPPSTTKRMDSEVNIKRQYWPHLENNYSYISLMLGYSLKKQLIEQPLVQETLTSSKIFTTLNNSLTKETFTNTPKIVSNTSDRYPLPTSNTSSTETAENYTTITSRNLNTNTASYVPVGNDTEKEASQTNGFTEIGEDYTSTTEKSRKRDRETDFVEKNLVLNEDLRSFLLKEDSQSTTTHSPLSHQSEKNPSTQGILETEAATSNLNTGYDLHSVFRLQNSSLSSFERIILDAVMTEDSASLTLHDNLESFGDNLKITLKNFLKDRIEVTTLDASDATTPSEHLNTKDYIEEVLLNATHSFTSRQNHSSNEAVMKNISIVSEEQSAMTDTLLKKPDTTPVSMREGDSQETPKVGSNTVKHAEESEKSRYENVLQDLTKVSGTEKDVEDIQDLLVDSIVHSVLKKIKTEVNGNMKKYDISNLAKNITEENLRMNKSITDKESVSLFEKSEPTTENESLTVSVSLKFNGAENKNVIEVEANRSKAESDATPREVNSGKYILNHANYSSYEGDRNNTLFDRARSWIPWLP